MSDNIKLSPINQKIVLDKKTNNLNNASTNVKVSDDSSKHDTFISRHKKTITFGSILSGIGLTVGACILAYNGKFGSKLQGFISGIVNKFSNNTNNVIPKTTSSIPTAKTPPIVLDKQIDISKPASIPQKPIQQAIHEVANETNKGVAEQQSAITKLVTQCVKDEKMYSITQAKNDDEILDVCLKIRNGSIKVLSDKDKTDVLDLGEVLNKTLCTEDKKKIFSLLKTEKMLQDGATIDEFPVILGEEENKLLSMYLEKTGSLDSAQQELIDKLIARNMELTELSDRYAQIIYDTPFNQETAIKNANSVMRPDIEMISRSEENVFVELEKMGKPPIDNKRYIKWRDSKKYPVIDLTLFKDEDDVSRFGFPSGTKKSDLRFYVHMLHGFNASPLNEATINEFSEKLSNYDFIWSKSFLSPNSKYTFEDRCHGFVTTPKVGQMHITYVDGRRTGYNKSISKGLENILSNEQDRLAELPNELKKQLNFSDEEYIELVKRLKLMGNIFSDEYSNSEIVVNGKNISIRQLRESVKKAQDRLLDLVEPKTLNNSKNNEILDETCDIRAIICKKRPDYMQLGRCKHISTDNSGIDDKSKVIIAKFIDDFKLKTGRELPIFLI